MMNCELQQQQKFLAVTSHTATGTAPFTTGIPPQLLTSAAQRDSSIAEVIDLRIEE
jgi:hypothetical protein